MADNDGEQWGNAIELMIGKNESRLGYIWDQSTELALRSVRVGSAITGSPGQPVDSGALRDSYTRHDINRWVREISSPLVYAPLIEAGIGRFGPLTLRSRVGGWHSLALTASSWQRIVDLVAADAQAFRV